MADCVDLRTAFPAYRISMEDCQGRGCRYDPWRAQIVNRRGQVYPVGGNDLCAFTERPGIGARLRALPFATIVQDGDTEVTIRFPADRFPDVDAILKLPLRRVLSNERRKSAAEHLRSLRVCPDKTGVKPG